jgi:hypothetical protein
MSDVEPRVESALHTDNPSSSKCFICVDEYLMDSSVVVADAITLAPTTQIVGVNGQMIAAVVALPVCLEHRKQQIAPKSKTGLVTV